MSIHADHAEFEPAQQQRSVSPDQNPKTRPPIVLLKEGGGKSPLFVIHGVDGELKHLGRMVRHLDASRPVYGILSQALVGDRVALTSVETLAAYYLRKVREVQPHGPYYLLGFSFGGMIAFEMAKGAYSLGEPVGMLGMLDTWRMAPPTAADGGPQFKLWRRLQSHVGRVMSVNGFSYARDKVVFRSYRTIYTLLDRIHQPIPRFLQRPIDINWFAGARYVPQHFPGKVTLFQAVASASSERASGSLWERVAGAGVEIRPVIGSHEDVMEEPNVGRLAREVQNYLADLP